MIMNAKRGFTLLLAVLVSSILLALGLAIYNVTAKQVILSSAGRESQFAFYAADTGIECTLYWDYQQNAFSTTSPRAQIACGATPNAVVTSSGSGDTFTRTFSFSMSSTNPTPCASVTVTKISSTQKTTVEALGYNTCDTTNPRRTERAIRVRY